ncbi:MAG: hypothetical protein ACTSRA_00365 [Promethearchaeota archaeon]|nr:MAG: major capsid protein/tail sheath protein [Helarchaeota virus Nidhogg Meg22_1012]URC17408.1 MAG: hypothetical protein [Helarchaeota virus Nidhogg Meg22_1214]
MGGLEYVDVYVNTEGLYQPLTRSYGNIGIVGTCLSGSDNEVEQWTSPIDEEAVHASGDLVNAVSDAFANGALRVFTVKSTSDSETDMYAALSKLASEDVQLVLYAGQPATVANTASGSTLYGLFKTHVLNASAAGRTRMGIIMLASGADTSDMDTVVSNMTSERMVLLAHHSSSDIAACAAGVISYREPPTSMTLKPIVCEQTEEYSDTDLATIVDLHIIPVTVPLYYSGNGEVMGKNFTLDGSGTRKYIDIVRTIDDVVFSLKAGLTSPKVMGNFRMNLVGMRLLYSEVAGILNYKKTQKYLDDYRINIPLLNLLERTNRTDAETATMNQIINSLIATVEVDIIYRGALESLIINVNFVPS